MKIGGARLREQAIFRKKAAGSNADSEYVGTADTGLPMQLLQTPCVSQRRHEAAGLAEWRDLYALTLKIGTADALEGADCVRSNAIGALQG